MDLKTGDILHCSGTSLLSRLIMKFTKSRFSHTALIVECWDRLYVVEAQNNGVNAKPFEVWRSKYTYSFEVSRPKDIGNKKEFSIAAFSKIGATPYDYVSLLFYQPLYILTGKWKGRKNNSSEGKMYCSEYVGWLFDFEKYWEMSPQDIFEKCQEADKFETLDI